METDRVLTELSFSGILSVLVALLRLPSDEKRGIVDLTVRPAHFTSWGSLCRTLSDCCNNRVRKECSALCPAKMKEAIMGLSGNSCNGRIFSRVFEAGLSLSVIL